MFKIILILICFFCCTSCIVITPNFGTIGIGNDLYIDKAEVTVGSWLTYYTWIKIRKGETEAKKILPDSNNIEPIIWEYINRTTATYSTIINFQGFQNLGYFCEECNDLNYLIEDSIKPKYCFVLEYPITGISYEQAVEYCKWRSLIQGEKTVEYRLPTPEEWIKAAKKDLEENSVKFGIPDSITLKHQPTYNYKQNAITVQNIKNEPNFETRLQRVQFDYKSKLANNIFGNVSEMTIIKGISKGGNYLTTFAFQCNIDSIQKYESPKMWLGFRCVVEKKIIK